jgi:hypothetical protein
VISGNVKFGHVLVAADANHDVVQGNFTGTDSTGTNPLPNSGVGLLIAGGASDNQIGGTVVVAGNLISGNLGSGIDIVGGGATNPPTRHNIVQGNFIGTDRSGRTAVPNQDGVFVEEAPGNVIGGATAASRDVISGNDVAVYIFGGGASGNQVLGNSIGPDAGAKVGSGNRQYGVQLYNAPSNTVAQSGPQANRFYRNLIANVREFTGAVSGEQSSGGTST